jgi:hypothetical protein
MGDRHARHPRPGTMTHKWRVVHFDAIPDPRIGPTRADPDRPLVNGVARGAFWPRSRA